MRPAACLILLMLSACAANPPCRSHPETGMAFYERVLIAGLEDEHWIPVNVVSPTYSGRAIIGNLDLWRSLHFMPWEEFVAMVAEHARAGKLVHIHIDSLDDWGCYPAPHDPEVECAAREGVGEFLLKYFDDMVLRKDLSLKRRAAILAQMFHWKIPARTDHATGHRVIFSCEWTSRPTPIPSYR